MGRRSWRSAARSRPIGAAALALGKLRATQAEKRLRELVEDDWDPGVRGRAKEALERIAG